MTKIEFYKLLDAWTKTPEYEEYEDLCFKCNTLDKQLINGAKIIKLFTKAMSNDIGKQLAKEPMFLEFLREQYQ